MSSEQTPESDRPSNKAADRLAVIVDAAERAALNVIDDAEKEAQRYLQEAQVRADRIVAERLREAADQIERNAGSNVGAPRLRPVEPAPEMKPAPPRETPPTPKEEVSGPPKREKPAPSEEKPKAETGEQSADREQTPKEADETQFAPKGEEKPAPSEPPRVVKEAPAPIPPPAPTGSAAARLLATQMAVSGSSREEIEARLKNGFEIEDTGEILDAILGPEEKADA